MPKKRKDKTSFVMHLKFRSSLSELNAEEYREIVEAMFDYTETREKPKLSSRLLNIVFNSIQEKMDEDYESWKETCKKKSEAKEEYWRNKKAEQNTIQEIQEYTSVYNTIQEINDYTRDTEYECDYDYDLSNNSVCNNAHARENKNICHLGNNFKNESCFNCQKKYKCPHEASAEFKLRHPEETFTSWNQKKTEAINQIVKDRKARGQPISQEEMNDLFENYNWLEDSKNEKKEGRK